jgi:hypothetical protein
VESRSGEDPCTLRGKHGNERSLGGHWLKPFVSMPVCVDARGLTENFLRRRVGSFGHAEEGCEDGGVARSVEVGFVQGRISHAYHLGKRGRARRYIFTNRPAANRHSQAHAQHITAPTANIMFY